MLPSAQAQAQSRRLVAALALPIAVLVMLGAVVAAPEARAALPQQPAVVQPSAASQAAAEVTTVLTDEVVRSGGTRTVALPGVPSSATSVTLKVEGRWAWRPTAISVCGGSSPTCASPRSFVTPTNARGSMEVTVPLSGTPRVTLHSSRASVRVTVQVLGHDAPAAAAPATKPGPANTGVPAGTALKVHQGDLTITTRGAVIDGLDVRGLVKVRAQDVTIKNSIIRGRPVDGNIHLVQNNDGGNGLTIVDSEISATHASPHIMGVLGQDFTLRRVNINNVIDQVTIVGDHVVIEDSWLHSNLHYTRDPNHGNTPSHDDNIQIAAGTNLRFEGNRLEGSRSAAVMITQGRGAVSGLTFRGNWVDGGSCSVNIAERNHGPLRGLAFDYNSFGTATRHPYCAIIRPLTTQLSAVGNTFTDGTRFALSRG